MSSVTDNKEDDASMEGTNYLDYKGHYRIEKYEIRHGPEGKSVIPVLERIRREDCV